MALQLTLQNWMSRLNPKTRVLDSYIPASHDSSSYPLPDNILISGIGGAITQSGNYSAQLNAGIRYFDVRCQWHKLAYVVGDNEVYLHHSGVDFEKFEDVLSGQIVPFANTNPGEIIFLDIDVNNDDMDRYDDLATTIMAILERYISKERFATAHLNPDGSFNKSVTWGDLKGTQFVVTWSYQDSRIFRTWLSYNNSIRWSPYGDFNNLPVNDILTYLDTQVQNWSKDKIFVAQVIDTPKVSPVQQPGILDSANHDALNNWVKKHGKGSNINVVFRDFVNSDYNSDVINYLINLNDFLPPNWHLCQAISSYSNNNFSESTFYSSPSFVLYYPYGAKMVLASNPDGTGNVWVDDQVTVVVTNINNKNTLQYQHDYSNGGNTGTTPESPTDISNLFPESGLYSATINLINITPPMSGASDFYLVMLGDG